MGASLPPDRHTGKMSRRHGIEIKIKIEIVVLWLGWVGGSWASVGGLLGSGCLSF